MDKVIERTAECRFCGQSKIRQFDAGLSDEECNEIVTLECTCKEGYDYRFEQKEKQKIKQMIDDSKSISFELFGSDYPGVVDLIDYIIPEMVKLSLEKVSISFEKVRCSIKFKEDEIKISRVDTKKQEDIASK